MKKIFWALLVGFAFLFAGFSGGKSDAGEKITVTGVINWYGNAPVEFPGLVTRDGKEYSLFVEESAKFTLKDITDCQGNLITVKGYVKKEPGFEVLKDGVITVKSFKKLSK